MDAMLTALSVIGLSLIVYGIRLQHKNSLMNGGIDGLKVQLVEKLTDIRRRKLMDKGVWSVDVDALRADTAGFVESVWPAFMYAAEIKKSSPWYSLRPKLALWSVATQIYQAAIERPVPPNERVKRGETSPMRFV